MDRWFLIRLVGMVVGLCLVVVLWRLGLAVVFPGIHANTAWTLATLAGGTVAAVSASYFSERARSSMIDVLRIKRQHAVEEGHFRLLADNAVDVIGHLRGKVLIWVSPSVEPAFGWPAEQWIGTDFTLRIHPDDLDGVFAALAEVSGGKSARVRYRIATASGDYRWAESVGKPYIDAQGKTDGVTFSTRVVDEQVEAELQLKAGKERFEALIVNSPSAISVRDLSHRFTLVNKAFCEMFSQKSVDDVIGRTEGEVLPLDVLERSQHAVAGVLAWKNCVEEESIQRGPDLISVMTQRFALRGPAGGPTAIVTMRTDVTDRKKALEIIAERALWAELIGAPNGSAERLLVYSQPIVDIATRQTVEEELLVRLRLVDTGEILPPSQFPGPCDNYKLMPVIDRYMVGCAIELARSGRRVSVNISGQTISNAAAIDEIVEMLAAPGPEVSGRIMVEITESTALASPAVGEGFSKCMRDLGCRIALDDFGTGYGTFSDLRRLHLDTLKIDQGFVRGMLKDPDDERAVKTLLSVAKIYGLSTIAEGVESEAVLEGLAELGVDRAQGYLFGTPKPIMK